VLHYILAAWHTFHWLSSVHGKLLCPLYQLHIIIAKASFCSAATKSTACPFLARLLVGNGCGFFLFFS
jgi:hypothetical protein